MQQNIKHLGKVLWFLNLYLRGFGDTSLIFHHHLGWPTGDLRDEICHIKHAIYHQPTSSWWFEPIWKILSVKLDPFPRDRSEKKNLWNLDLDLNSSPESSFYSCASWLFFLETPKPSEQRWVWSVSCVEFFHQILICWALVKLRWRFDYTIWVYNSFDFTKIPQLNKHFQLGNTIQCCGFELDRWNLLSKIGKLAIMRLYIYIHMYIVEFSHNCQVSHNCK